MITKFTTVYAGHVDLPDCGQNATPVNERPYSNEHLATVFDKTEAISKKTDSLGFDILWLAEHHFQHEGYECIPNDLMPRPIHRPVECWQPIVSANPRGLAIRGCSTSA